MRNNNIFIFTALSVILLSISENILAQFKIDAQYRPRFEIRDGYQKLASEGSTPGVFISQRMRVTFSYETEFIKLKLTPQDVRIWGDEQLASSTGVYGDYASLELFEGFAELKLGNLGWISVGRQRLNYDSKRLLGDRNWNQNGLTYDAVVFKLKPFSWDIHFGSIWNSISENSSDNLYPTNRIKSLNYLWLNREISENWKVSILHVSSGITQTDTTNQINFRHTTGFYTDLKQENLKIWGNFYYQYGKNKTGRKASAFLFDADAAYKIGIFNPGIGIGYLSGNNKSGTDLTRDNLFDVLYGTRHTYFGLIDYFRDFSSNTRQGGLIDYYFYLNFILTKNISIRNTAHYFQLAQTNPDTPDNKNLGYENDIVLNYKFNDWVVLESGYFFFLPTNTLRTIQNVQNNKFSQFFYLQLTITPNIYTYQQTGS